MIRLPPDSNMICLLLLLLLPHLPAVPAEEAVAPEGVLHVAVAGVRRPVQRDMNVAPCVNGSFSLVQESLIKVNKLYTMPPSLYSHLQIDVLRLSCSVTFGNLCFRNL